MAHRTSVSTAQYQNYLTCKTTIHALWDKIFFSTVQYIRMQLWYAYYVYRVKWGPLFGQCTKGGWAARALVGLSLEGPHVCISGNSVKFLGYWSPGLASYYNQRQADSCQDEWEGRERGKTHGHCGQPAGSKSNVYVMYICIYSIL
jgi:hypothetical protein